jgi:hypothetical protein
MNNAQNASTRTQNRARSRNEPLQRGTATILYTLVVLWRVTFIFWRAIENISMGNKEQGGSDYFGEYEGPGLVGLQPWAGLCIAGLVGEYRGDVGLNLGLVGE